MKLIDFPFPAKVRVALLAAIGSMWLVFPALPASAQQADQQEERPVGPPIRLLPDEDGKDERRAGRDVRRDNPARREDTARERSPGEAGIRARRQAEGETRSESEDRPRIRREELGPPNIEATGFLSAKEGGLGFGLWRGASRAAVQNLLPRLPDRSPSAVVRDLTRRLLATSAEPPEGPSETDFLSLRAQQLFAMGRLEDVLRLVNGLDRKEAPAGRIRAEISSSFLLYGAEKTCALVGDYAKEDTNPYLEQALVVCSALAGQHDEAQLGIRLLAEQNVELSPAFLTLVDAQRPVSDAAVDTMPSPTAFTTVLLTATQLPLPRDFGEAGGAAFLRAAALSDNPTRSRRLAAMESAVAHGALPAEKLAEAYAKVGLRPALYAAAVRVEPSRYDLTRRIVLYQAAKGRAAGEARLEVLRHWWSLTQSAGNPAHAAMVARVTLPMLQETVPSNALAPYAHRAGRAAYWAGDVQRGFAWYQILANSDLREPAHLASLAALTRLAGQTTQFGPAELEAWVANARERHPDDADSRILYLYALMDGLDEAEVQRAMWQPYLAGVDTARRLGLAEANLADLLSAARDGRKGLALLLMLSTIGNRSFAEVDAGTIRAMLIGLRALDLSEEARAMALEAALARGL